MTYVLNEHDYYGKFVREIARGDKSTISEAWREKVVRTHRLITPNDFRDFPTVGKLAESADYALAIAPRGPSYRVSVVNG